MSDVARPRAVAWMLAMMMAIVMLVPCLLPRAAGAETIVLASTTSTENSGLFELILPVFKRRTGIEVRVVSVGTGQALRLARRGDADVLLVHDRASEDAFVADGYGVKRWDVMYNDFVLLGPPDDPAGIRGLHSSVRAFRSIAEHKSPFVSRGDDSGTHKAELRIWSSAGIDPSPASGSWYRETGVGMGATLNIASAMNVYVLSDRGSWLSFKNKGELELHVEGDPPFFNPYGVILVDPERHPHVKVKAGQAFIDWLVGAEGQSMIGSLRVNGVSLFVPNAKPN